MTYTVQQIRVVQLYLRLFILYCACCINFKQNCDCDIWEWKRRETLVHSCALLFWQKQYKLRNMQDILSGVHRRQAWKSQWSLSQSLLCEFVTGNGYKWWGWHGRNNRDKRSGLHENLTDFEEIPWSSHCTFSFCTPLTYCTVSLPLSQQQAAIWPSYFHWS